MKLYFKAKTISDLETKFGKTIDQIIGDTRIDTLAYIVSKSIVNDSEEKPIGCSLEVAFDKIDELLKESKNGIQEISLLIIDSLCELGFLPEVMKTTREVVESQMEKAKTQMKK